MLSALGLSIAQLTDRRILAVLGKSVVLTLIALIVLGNLAWFGLDSLIDQAGLRDEVTTGASTLRGLIAAIAALIGTWILFRMIAIAILQFYADEVVEAVELKHYPAWAQTAQPLGAREEMRIGFKGFVRAGLWNLAALPVAGLLLLSGLGPALLFLVVNAVLLGRELTDMVRLRHRDATGEPLSPPSHLTRLLLGLIVAGLLAVPFLNLLAPMIGAAAATHLVLRRNTGVATHAA
jgi:uncharacterized protein involved in cysteine biosynthesis